MSIKALVVHGYGYNRDGWLGLNEVVCQKAAELWKTGEYDYLLLPAGVNEDTGDGKRLIAEDQLTYLMLNEWRDITPARLQCGSILWSPECAGPIASDTMTECRVAFKTLLLKLKGSINGIDIDAIGVFPHSLKIQRCWKLFIRQEIPPWNYYDFHLRVELKKMHHVSPRLDSRSETIRQFIMNVISTTVGLFDPWGRYFPAKQIKMRRRDLYTPKHLRDRVIF